jgi:hypothetical protein
MMNVSLFDPRRIIMKHSLSILSLATCLSIPALGASPSMGRFPSPQRQVKPAYAHHLPQQHHHHHDVYEHGKHHHDKAIQIALLLDTSSSMSGLINQAREHLWNVVNAFAESKSSGDRPRLEVALYEYGNSELSARQGYIRRICPFTSDLDALSEALFSLSTNGGSEHCGQVIQRSLHELNWSMHGDSFKAVFIAGNEPFTQGPIPWNQSCRKAVEQEVKVNTIFCGQRAEGINTGWKDGALMGQGEYMNIDHHQVSVYRRAPQDDRISQLNGQLNDTYIYYGQQGARNMRRQKSQDSAAQKLSMNSFLSRAASKSSSLYNNSSWDLVDAMEGEELELNEDIRSSLAPELKGMDEEELKEHVQQQKNKRESIQKEIAQLQKQRNHWIEEQKKEENENKKNGIAEDRDKDLGEAMIKALQKQTAEKGISLP